jgi:signal transduction histidine kinase
LPRGEWLIEFDPPTAPILGEAALAFSETLNGRLGDAAQVEEAWFCSEDRTGCPYSVLVRIRFKDSQPLWVGYRLPAPERPQRNKGIELQGRIAIFIGIMAIVGWVVVRLALRPLRRLAQAVEDFGRDITHPPMDDSGPSEVRQAAQAFNAMQRQIHAYMAERTQILAAVTHDLKTPMTRMRLRLENCADEALKDRLQADLAAMQSLVEEGLQLARSLDTVEPTQPVDLDALLQSLCDDLAESGLGVAYQGSAVQGIVVKAQPNALRRVFENLIDNAIKYGQQARVGLEQRGNMACVRVRDSGPGIPEGQLENVFRPFVRLEASRSRDTGGTGLGLAIAANLLKIQQGGISLRNHPQGGLEVNVRLPVAAMPK